MQLTAVLRRFVPALVLGAMVLGVGRPAPVDGAGPCPLDAAWDSLCNVEPELRRSYGLIEQVVDLPGTRDRISGMVRERRVNVRWNWDDVNIAHLGAFNALTSEVLVSAHVRGEPDRVEASILAHELWHAYGGMQGWYRPATRAACLQDERSAFATGLLFYDHLLARSGPEAAPRSQVDAWLMQLVQDWRRRGGGESAMEAIANEHLVRDGYLQRCLRYPASNAALPGWLSPMSDAVGSPGSE